MKGVLVSGGNNIDENILEEESENAYIICADGGVKNFLNTNLKPDLLVGDLDSISNEGVEFLEKNNIKVDKFPPKKNLTDTELALTYLLEKKCSSITILSATGTRMDHTISNILSLEKLYKLKVPAKLVDNHNEIIYVEEGKIEVNKDDYKYLSLISLSDYLIYSTIGMEYETDHLKIYRYSARGVSNEIKEKSAKINIHFGKGLIIKSRD
ncbi:thiamine diphosphokinase [Peptoniphilus stercorisuis]|uniref:Thiamine diphosphokinase n=1 Tax=Peptoniphilus stercorisuis TaxID=1436965 RepID=A0ABS4KDK4_9FIRM|nr:thiamine diphosphokinase [Peptoniphilus stercorisuis]MBP2025856.1 thiamine pyrophosphokinase [Peptoniphilus stercorisuis]